MIKTLGQPEIANQKPDKKYLQKNYRKSHFLLRNYVLSPYDWEQGKNAPFLQSCSTQY